MYSKGDELIINFIFEKTETLLSQLYLKKKQNLKNDILFVVFFYDSAL